MLLSTVNLTYEEKQDNVFALLSELKNYNQKVKWYYLWLKMKVKLPEFELDQIYETVVWAISEAKQAEFDRKLLIFEKNKRAINEMRWIEECEEEDEKRKQATSFLRLT